MCVASRAFEKWNKIRSKREEDAHWDFFFVQTQPDISNMVVTRHLERERKRDKMDENVWSAIFTKIKEKRNVLAE